MKQLWAPWRLDYIQGESSAGGCIFCLGDKAAEDASRLVLVRGAVACVLMNRFPYSNGHLLIAPYRHIADIVDLDEAEVLEMHALLRLCREVLGERVGAQGFNIGMNLGQIAGAGIAEHLHLHIVPRWIGDTNFMPVFAEVRVIPQHLEETYQLLRSAFAGRKP
jgi:ATP adenylyltransferase